MSANLITIREARERVLAVAPRLPAETIDVTDGLGRVLAEDLSAAGDVPAFPCSAMDGYALTAGPAGRSLEVIGESRAGAPTKLPVSDGAAVRISTGAAVPQGATAVIRQEDTDTDAHDGRVHIRAAVATAENIRPAGDDMRSGARVLRSGTLLGPAELGAAVAAGAGQLAVSKQPRVSVFCTGDELRAPGEPLGPGEIHNSNAPMLVGAAIRCGAIADPAQRLPDDRQRTEAGLAQALADADAVVISGGISVGPHDHVKPALAALGVDEVFWGVALQPGKPTWFGTKDGVLVFGLPGNPVSAAVTFSLFVAPALAAMQGEVIRSTQPAEAILATAVARNPRREQAVRVVLERHDASTFAVPNGPQGSHIVTSLVGADALALIPPGEGELEAGSRVSLAQLTR